MPTKGIYAEEIESWKKSFINGETDEESKIKQEFRDSQTKLKLTKKELDLKEKALVEAAALLVLKKRYKSFGIRTRKIDHPFKSH